MTRAEAAMASTDDPEAALFALWMALPETATATMNSIMDEYMAPASHVGTMKVLNLRLNQEDEDASR